MNMIYIDLKDDLSEKMVYDYPDCPAYTIHEMLSHYPNYSAISHWHDDIEFLMILSSFSLIWALLLEHLPSASRTEDHTNTDLTAIRNMTGFIQQNYTSRISLKEIAAAGSVGISKCCKLFSRYFSQSPNLYLNQYRLNKSAQLLRETDMTITEIALSTGFGSASYYAESFRKWAGMSPGKFRKT